MRTVKEKVVLTGATGFLGYHIAKTLVAQNYEVTALVRSEKGVDELKRLGCVVKTGKLNDGEFIDKSIENQDYVIHCASLTKQTDVSFENYRIANFLSTELLVRSSKKHLIKRFVLVSTANCFRNGTISSPGNEISPFMNYLKNSNYAYSKYLAQQMVLEEVRETGFPGIVVAPTFMIGPHDRKPSSGQLLMYGCKNSFLFYPSRGGKSFVDVSAAAVATVNALRMGRIGECYLLSGVNKSYREYFRMVAGASERKKRLIPVPVFVSSSLGLLLGMVPTKKNKMTKANMKLFFSGNYFSNDKARLELQMPDTDFEKSFYESMNWFRENGYIS